MKRHTLSMNVTAFTKKAFIAAALFFAATTATLANSGDPKIDEPEIRHLGKTFDSNYFQVKWNNNTGDKFIITIRENSGAILFQETYSDEVFDKKFKLPKKDDGSLIISFRTLKDNQSESYAIDTNTRIVEEVVIRKVD